jgi:hypothetical protein
MPRLPGARFFIPSLDEWTKAAYFDPNRVPDATGQSPQWWLYPNGTDTQMTYGVPGVGMANAGFDSPSPYGIPLGAYTNVFSPWGLFDMAGGTSEWCEDAASGLSNRYQRGTGWTSLGGGTTSPVNDLLTFSLGAGTSSIMLDSGLRIAALIPTPGAALLLPLVVVCGGYRRRRNVWSGRRVV